MRNRFELRCLLKYLLDEDQALLVRAVARAVGKITTARGFQSINAFLDHHRLRHLYSEAMSISTGEVTDVIKLTQCVALLQIPLDELFEIDYRPAPFNEWRPGAVLVVLLGQRPVHISGDSSSHDFNVVGGRDMVAISELTSQLHSFLRVDYRLEPKIIRSESTLDEVEAELNKIKKRPEVQMVLSLGSPFVNIGSECVARRIASQAKVDDLPFKFLFSHQSRQAGILPPGTSLLVGPQCDKQEEGIERQGKKRLSRMHDHLVASEVKKGVDGPFADCGVVLLDCSTDQYLAVCAGHGGCGTIASVLALTASDAVGAAIEKSREDKGPLGQNRIAEFVWARRYKPGPNGAASLALDDLDFDREFEKGWGIAAA